MKRTKQNRYARVVELADSLDSGSSVHYARAGSAPASRTKKKDTASAVSFFFYFNRPRPPEPLSRISTNQARIRQTSPVQNPRAYCPYMPKYAAGNTILLCCGTFAAAQVHLSNTHRLICGLPFMRFCAILNFFM